MASGGMSGGSGPEPVVQQIAFLSALIAIWACWPLVRMQIPADAQFAFADLVREHWVHRDALQPWLDRRWAWLAMHAYHLWFALATLPGCIAVAVVQGLARRPAWPIIHAPLGWRAGTSPGYNPFRRFPADNKTQGEQGGKTGGE